MGPESINRSPGRLLTYREIVAEGCLSEMRAVVKMHAADLGFSVINQTKIVTSASELGRNMIEHANGGSLSIEHVQKDARTGMRLIFTDSGPGIENIQLALTDGYSSKKGLGLGLSGSKRLMDEFEIDTTVGAGSTIVVTKWM